MTRLVPYALPIISLVFASLLLAPVGCALLTQPAVMSAIDLVAEEVLKRTGEELDAHPTHCEYENDPDSGKLLILCTVCYGVEEGGSCS